MFQRNNHGNISSKVSAIIIMVIGIGIMIVGILMAADRMRKDDYYGFATGKVVGSSYYENSDDERMYSAIYAYSVGDTEYELEDDDASKVPPQIGKKVEIRYDPEEPADAYVGGKPLPGSILMGIGITMIMLSILAFVKMRKGKISDERKLVIELLTGIIYNACGLHRNYQITPGQRGRYRIIRNKHSCMWNSGNYCNYLKC